MLSFNIKNVIFLVGGFPMSGYAEGSKIEVKRKTEHWRSVAGTDGEVARSRVHDDRYEIKVTFMPHSTANVTLNTLLLADKLTGQGIVPVSLLDPSTGEQFLANGAWVMQSPGVVYSNGIEGREWTLETSSGEELRTGLGA
jgi:hypothetical protein